MFPPHVQADSDHEPPLRRALHQFAAKFDPSPSSVHAGLIRPCRTVCAPLRLQVIETETRTIPSSQSPDFPVPNTTSISNRSAREQHLRHCDLKALREIARL